MTRFITGRQLKSRLIDQRLLLAGGVWIAVSAGVILTTWALLQWATLATHRPSSTQQTALAELAKHSAENDSLVAGLPNAQDNNAMAQATVLGVNETPASPPSLPPPEQLAEIQRSTIVHLRLARCSSQSSRSQSQLRAAICD